MRTLLLAALALGGSAMSSPAAAQDARTTDGRGLAWVGCWQAADGIQAQGRVCVIPIGDRDLRIVSLDAENKTTESTLHLDGVKRDVDAEGCSGWEQARLSTDGDRIVVDAQLRCGESPAQKRTTAFLITPAGYWLQVNGAGISTVANAQVRLYRTVESYAEFPAAIRAAVAPVAAEAEQARMRVMDRVVSANDLVELDEMGVAAPVIDLVVAASYPSTFIIDGQGAMSAVAANLTGGVNESRSYASFPFYYQNGFPMLSFYDMAMLDNCARFGLFSCAGMGYSSFGYNRYGYGMGYYGGFWPGYGGYGYGGIPVVVRPITPAPNDPSGGNGRGRAVRGEGYSSGSSSTGTRVASPRSGASTTSNSGSGSASSAGGSAGGSSGSAGSSGSSARTAKPRSP